MVEQLAVNQQVIGSSPFAPTITWELGVDGLTRKIEALEAGVRFPEVPLNLH